MRTFMTVLALVALASAPLTALAQAQAKGAAASASQVAGTQLTPVETKRVCMVTDRVFERDQIPVQVGSKTYYGCCAMCKDRLQQDASVREATDPVTGKKVDKASAYIAAQADGSVLYFGSEATYKQFKR